MAKKISLYFFYLFIFLTPFLAPSPLIRFGRWLGRLPYGTVHLAILAICFLFFLFLVPKIIREKPPFKKETFWLWLFLAGFILVNFISLIRFYPQLFSAGPWTNIFNPRKPLGYASAKFIWLATGFLVFFLAKFLLDSWEKVKTGLKIYIFSANLACLFGYYLLVKFFFKLGKTPVQKYIVKSWVFPRLIGPALEPQTFANLLISVVFLTLVFYIIEKKFWLRVFFLASAWLQTVSLLLTFSLAGWLVGTLGLTALLTGLAIFGQKELRQKIFLFLLPFLFFLALALALSPQARNASASLFKKFQNPSQFSAWNVRKIRKDPAAYSVLDRYYARQFALKLWGSRPLLGWGPGSFGYLYQLSENKERFLRLGRLPRSHQQYLEILAESGILGLAAFAGCLFLYFRVTLKKFKTLETEKQIMLAGILGTNLALLFYGFSLTVLVHQYFWLVFGFGLAVEKD